MENLLEFFQSSICKILFPYTVELARKGYFKEAEVSLRFMLDHDPSPEYYLLLGKIYAQQGRYQEAIGEWKRILERDPENHEAKAAISKAEGLSKGILPAQLFKWKLATGILGVFLVLSLGMDFILWKGKIDISSQYRASLEEKQTLLAKTQKLEGEVREGRKEIDASRNRYQEITRKYKERKIKYNDLLESYKKLERQMGEQIVVALKGGHLLTQIEGIGDSGITVELTDKETKIYGEVPTEYLRRLIEETVKGMEWIESASNNLQVTHKYVVKEGDTLSRIAEKNYGDYKKAKDIQQANSDKIKDLDRIYKNDILDMP